LSQRRYVRQGSRQTAHTVRPRSLPLLPAGVACLLIATLLGGGAWYLVDARRLAVSDHAAEQVTLNRAVFVTQTSSRPDVASAPRVTPTTLASARERPAVVSKAAMPGAALAKNRPNIADEVEGFELANSRPNIADEVEGVVKLTAARRAAAASPQARDARHARVGGRGVLAEVHEHASSSVLE
jgi:hypothetical protein